LARAIRVQKALIQEALTGYGHFFFLVRVFVTRLVSHLTTGVFPPVPPDLSKRVRLRQETIAEV